MVHRAGTRCPSKLLLLAAVSVCLVSCSQAGRRPEELYRQAYQDFLQARLPEADQKTRQGMEAWKADPASGWSHKFALLRAQVLLFRGRADVALGLLNSLDSSNLSAALEVHRKALLGNVLLKLGRYPEAGAALDKAERQAQAEHLPAAIPEIELVRGNLLRKDSKETAAENVFQSALSHAREQHDTLAEAQAHNNLGLLREEEHPDQAIAYFQEAYTLLESIGASLYGSGALDNLSICHAALGDFDRAVEAKRKAISIFEKGSAKLYLGEALGFLGNLYLARGEPLKAQAEFQRALELALEIKHVDDAAEWASNLAATSIQLRQWQQAETYNRQAADLKYQTNSLELLPYLRLNSAGIAAGREDWGQAAGLYRELIADPKQSSTVLWEAHAALAALLARQAGRAGEARAEYERALQVIEQARAELKQGQYRITFLARLIQFYQQYVEMLVQQGDTRKALAVADSSRALVLRERLQLGAARTGGPAVPYERLAAGRDSVLLAYWLAPRESYLWLVSAKELRLFRLPPEREIAGLVASYQKSLEKDLRDPLAAPADSPGRKLYGMLIQPASQCLPRGARVIVVPDGVLHSLNLETLVAPGDPGHYWIEDAIVSVAPSLRLLGEKAASRPPPAHSVLLIGDPSEADAAFPKLRYASSEIDAIQQRFPALHNAIYTGPRATPEAYRQGAAATPQPSLIHFTAHAVANPQSPLESAVILSPGPNGYKLYASDIMAMPIQASLVTLSACHSAGAKAYAGEGLVGFAWAFLHAGAREVIAGLWDAGDRSTAALMGDLYDGLQKDQPPVEALRIAKLRMIHSSSATLRQPYHWGPFQVYTGANASR